MQGRHEQAYILQAYGLHPLQTNMEPENWPVQNDVPLPPDVVTWGSIRIAGEYPCTTGS